MNQAGKFITLEGGEGAGKSTNLAIIRDCLQQAGVDLIETREPGGTELSEAIRALLLDRQYTGMHEQTELLLMFAARAEHLQQKILPALARGQWVLCDRFTDASYAYQGGGRQMNKESITQLEQWVQGDVRPDYTLLLDVPVEIGMQRAMQRGEADRFESEQQSFFERVRAAYLARAEQAPERFRIIDASKDLPEVEQQIREVMANICPN